MATTSDFYDYPGLDKLAQWAVEGREPRMVTYKWQWQAVMVERIPLALDPKSKQR